MWKRTIKWAPVAFLIAIPIVVTAIHRHLTRLPDRVVIAAGPVDGRYFEVADILADLLREQTRGEVEVEVKSTGGSLANMAMLKDGRADFAFFQHGARDMNSAPGDDEDDNTKQARSDAASAAFVANLYREYVHFVVRRALGVDADSRQPIRRLAVGMRDSGDYATGTFLLDHLHVNEQQIKIEQLPYSAIRKRFKSDELDAAILATGLRAPICRDLLESPANGESPLCYLRPIPFARAFAAKHIAVSVTTIPIGLYAAGGVIEPNTDIETITVQAQLITRADLNTRLVEETTRVILSEEFQKRARLQELFSDGREFARDKPEFAIHVGASNVYDPELKPFLDPEFADSTESLRSFIVSVLIAGFLLWRWLRERAKRSKEHRLDRYIREVLKIEKQQIAFDQIPGKDDSKALQTLLDEVTYLRQSAMREFTAHELSEDRAIDCFIEMCHALSDKINAKITRQRMESIMRTRVNDPDA